MKFKKVSVLLVAFVFALFVPTTVSAEVGTMGAGEWDYLGHSVFHNQSIVFKSGGGNFKACISTGSAGGRYSLMEQDPVNPDDEVNTEYIPPGGCHTWNVASYVDGTNGKAELYLAICNWCKDRDYQTRADFWD